MRVQTHYEVKKFGHICLPQGCSKNSYYKKFKICAILNREDVSPDRNVLRIGDMLDRYLNYLGLVNYQEEFFVSFNYYERHSNTPCGASGFMKRGEIVRNIVDKIESRLSVESVLEVSLSFTTTDTCNELLKIHKARYEVDHMKSLIAHKNKRGSVLQVLKLYDVLNFAYFY